MAIKLDCPRCKKPLSVPRKKLGRYVNCPRCGGRFWVPEKAADVPGADAAVPSSSTSGSLPPPPGPHPQPPDALPAAFSMGSAVTVSPGDVAPQTPGGDNAPSTHDTGLSPPGDGADSPWQVMPLPAPSTGQPPAVPPPPPGLKTARFVSAEAAQSTLKLAEDGKLPELHLRVGQEKDKREAKTSSVNPLVLFGLLAISVALSIALALLDVGPPKAPLKEQARRKIEETFFPRDGQEPLQYQEYLMKAQRANTQGDLQAEQKAYEKVLDLLRQERPPYVKSDKQWSVTTSPRGDEELKRLISTLLSNDY
jgi:DNA-directed RNA polymerase subunit RPC12/RpoP